MKPNVFFGVCAAIVGYALLYTLPIYARLPRTFYDPLARRWFVASSASSVPMGYYGQIVWGIAGALIVSGVVMMLTSRRARAGATAPDRAFALGTAWTLTTIAIVLGYFTWNNWP